MEQGCHANQLVTHPGGVLRGAFRPEAGGKVSDVENRRILVCANQSCCLLNAFGSRFSKCEESVAGSGRAGRRSSFRFSFPELSVTCNLQ